MTDYIQKDNWYEGKTCAKYGGTNFTYGTFTLNPRELSCFFLLDILHFTMAFRGIGLSNLSRLIFR